MAVQTADVQPPTEMELLEEGAKNTTLLKKGPHLQKFDSLLLLERSVFSSLLLSIGLDVTIWDDATKIKKNTIKKKTVHHLKYTDLIYLQIGIDHWRRLRYYHQPLLLGYL